MFESNNFGILNKAKAQNKAIVLEILGTFAIAYIGGWCIIYRDLNLITANGVAIAHALASLLFIWPAI